MMNKLTTLAVVLVIKLIKTELAKLKPRGENP